MTLKFLKNNKIKQNTVGISLSPNRIFAFARMTFVGLSSLGERSSFLSSLCKGQRPATQRSIKHAICFITAVCAMLLTSTIALADDTTITETCADGAGEIVTGVVTGHKYCKSNNTMNWWNANVWCDALGGRLFNLDDCATVHSTYCPELNISRPSTWLWTSTPYKTSQNYFVNFSGGGYISYYSRSGTGNLYALCY